jgi:hypothetical protein
MDAATATDRLSPKPAAGNIPRMRLLLVVVVLAAVSACAEAVRGPRLVTYTPDRFYIRHLPWHDSRSSIDTLAGARCEQIGKQAMLESAEQFAVLDLRYATYRCAANPSAADAT